VFRSLLAALLVLALIPAVAAANATTWAKRSVLDQRTFTEVVDRALDSPEAEEALAEQLAPALFDTLVGADERARLVLAPIAGQSADASDDAIIRGLEPRIRAALESPRFDAARERLVIAAHRTLVGLDDPDSTVRIDGDALIVDAADLLRVLLDTIDSRIGALGIDVPESANVDIELASSPGLAAPIERPTWRPSRSEANAEARAVRTAEAASSPRVGPPGTQTANSSPPRRPTTPWAARWRATSVSTRSPVAWPWPSLTALK